MPKKRLIGKVISNKMKKTVVVEVESVTQHPKYKRTYKVHKRYKAHNETGECKVGDTVLIEECRPISKEKKWRVVKKIASQIGEGSGEPKGSPVEENSEPVRASD